MTMAATRRARPTGSMCRASASAIVAIRATAIPAMPNVLPALDVSCLDNPASARMNRMAATTYAAVAVVSSVNISAPREHGQHAAGHGEAAEDVDAGEQDRQGRQCGDDDTAGFQAGPDLQQRADDDDPGDRVGHRHERRVQGMVHVADHVVAD